MTAPAGWRAVRCAALPSRASLTARNTAAGRGRRAPSCAAPPLWAEGTRPHVAPFHDSNVHGSMPYIRQVEVDEATGLLRRLFDAALRRAGRVWRIVHVMSVNPRTMDASLDLYGAIMFGASPLTRVQREMLATVVSAELNCFY